MTMRFKHILAAAGAVLTMAAVASSGPIRVSVRDTTVVGGSTLSYAVRVDSSLTGLGVSSYQFELTYNTAVLSFDSITVAGTISSSWTNTLANETTPGHVVVAGVGTPDLPGTGPLVFLYFTAKVSAYTSYSSMAFASFTFNEGTPAATTVGATVTVSPPPSITVSPDNATLTKGDTQMFTAYSAVGPVTWVSTNTSVATISGAGLLTALSAGTTRVVATDSVGTVDTSGTIEVRGLKLSLRDTSVYQGQTLDIPITTTDVTGLGIVSGQLDLTYNQNLWTATDVISVGTIVASAGTPEFQVSSGKISISFAGSTALSGSGTLLIVRLKATTSTYGYSFVGFQNVLFNENLAATTQSAGVSVTQLSTLTVSPGGTQYLVKGDSLQFSASGGTGPYTWSVSDSSKGQISSTGLLTVLRGGSVVVSAHDVYGSAGSSGTINLSDFRLTVPAWSQYVFAANDTSIELPLTMTGNDTGFTAFQLTITYPTYNGIVLDSVLSSGTLSSSWLVQPSFSSGSVTIAAAGVDPVTSAGTLLRLHFLIPGSTPRPSTTSLTITNAQFNEGAPIASITNGWLGVRSTNSKPVLSSKSPSTLDSLLVGSSQIFGVSVYDADGDPLTYAWSVDDTVKLSGSSNTFNGVFPSPTPSTTVKVVFNDPFGFRDSASWTFKVVTNHPPTSFTFTQPTIDTVKSFNIPIAIAWAQASDSDNDSLTYLIRIVGGGLDTMIVTKLDSTSINSARLQASSSYTITGKVTDGMDTVNASNSKSFVTASVLTSAGLAQSGLPNIFVLSQNYPNPFNPSTTIQFSIPKASFVTLTIYDILGNEVERLVSGSMPPGVHSVQWDAGSYANGTYFYRLVAGNFIQTRKLILLK